jgi:hypothetical protein
MLSGRGRGPNCEGEGAVLWGRGPYCDGGGGRTVRGRGPYCVGEGAVLCDLNNKCTECYLTLSFVFCLTIRIYI